jgi:hypothetical protein
MSIPHIIQVAVLMELRNFQTGARMNKSTKPPNFETAEDINRAEEPS